MKIRKLTSEEIENLKYDLHRRNREIYQLVDPKVAVSDGFVGNFFLIFKDQTILMLQKSLPSIG